MEPRVLWLAVLLDASLWLVIAGTLFMLCGLLLSGCDLGRIRSGATTSGLAGVAAILCVGLLAASARE